MKENPTTERSEKNFCVFRHQKEKPPNMKGVKLTRTPRPNPILKKYSSKLFHDKILTPFTKLSISQPEILKHKVYCNQGVQYNKN